MSIEVAQFVPMDSEWPQCDCCGQPSANLTEVTEVEEKAGKEVSRVKLGLCSECFGMVFRMVKNRHANS